MGWRRRAAGRRLTGPVYTRHLEIPALSEWPDTVASAHVNIVQRALGRMPGPLRLDLPNLKTLDLLLMSDAWVVVDRSLHDLPIVAWTDFERVDRGLHEPVACRLKYFHGLAGMVVAQVLAGLGSELTRKLGDGEGEADVVLLSDVRQTRSGADQEP